MLYTRIRYALILLFFGLGILLHLREGLSSAWYLYLAAAILLLTYLLFGSVWTAFGLLRKGKPDEAERVLKQIYFPELLIRRHRAYYHFCWGMIHLQRKELQPGEQDLKKALELDLDQEVDRALAELNLAHIYYLQQRFDQSRQYLQQAKSREADDLLIRNNVEKLEKALASLPGGGGE